MAFTIKTKTPAAVTTRDNDEFAGLWINVGAKTASEDGTEKMNRLPRGIAVSDLKEHRIYANTNPDWAEEASLVNEVIAAIRERGLQLAEGESVELNLSVQLYRRQEQVEAAPVANSGIKESLFG